MRVAEEDASASIVGDPNSKKKKCWPFDLGTLIPNDVHYHNCLLAKNMDIAIQFYIMLAFPSLGLFPF